MVADGLRALRAELCQLALAGDRSRRDGARYRFLSQRHGSMLLGILVSFTIAGNRLPPK
jgi:hypothetical protein